MFGINGAELLVLLLIAVLVVGPERLPRYTEQLGRAVRKLRVLLDDAKERVSSELGEEAKDVDWEALDPRRYDPRRIVRDALLEPQQPPPSASGTVYTTGTRPSSSVADRAARGVREAPAADRSVPGGAGQPPSSSEPAPVTAPFDDEAT